SGALDISILKVDRDSSALSKSSYLKITISSRPSKSRSTEMRLNVYLHCGTSRHTKAISRSDRLCEPSTGSASSPAEPGSNARRDLQQLPTDSKTSLLRLKCRTLLDVVQNSQLVQE